MKTQEGDLHNTNERINPEKSKTEYNFSKSIHCILMLCYVIFFFLKWISEFWVLSEFVWEGNRLYSYHLSRVQSHPPNYTTYYLTPTELRSQGPGAQMWLLCPQLWWDWREGCVHCRSWRERRWLNCLLSPQDSVQVTSCGVLLQCNISVKKTYYFTTHWLNFFFFFLRSSIRYIVTICHK